MQIIAADNIDFQKYETCLFQSDAEGILAAHPLVLNAVMPNKWQAVVWGNYDAVAPVFIQKKMGLKYCLQAPFTQQSGVFAKQNISKQSFETTLLSYLKRHCFLLEYHGNTASENKQGEKLTNIILKKEPALNKNHKRNIAKASQHNLQYKAVEALLGSPFIIRNLLLQNTVEPKLSAVLERLFLALTQNFSASFYGVFLEGELISCGLFVRYAKRTYFIKGATLSIGKDIGATHFLLNNFLNHNWDKSTTFDFVGGSNSGLSKFYKGFGGKEEFYPVYKQKGWFF
jgi:hypothetical protein